MNIVSVKYRFLRLNSEQLALVEFYPFSLVPEPTKCLYPYPPYLTNERLKWSNILEPRDWVTDWKYAFDLAVEEAKSFLVIDYLDKLWEEREAILWGFLDPLQEIVWDEYCPLFDNDFNLILRD